ncbi:3'-5' exonuclease [Leucobacter sp. M11]|uniref:3'-5' exonuclease n=1 Tax=Leucobacter sp. M11 TaxID=2993565 RepID=UPI002D809395|nr:3'-5' exonuclease [Leucobacter sp. M11]MEB4615807.1 3'-5' exonuclease [Leucobacter sp. M11]
MPINFSAIDFETANSNSASACSVGLIRVREGVVVDRQYWLIKPPEAFAAFLPWNIKIHGITPEQVEFAESWEQQLPRLLDFLGDDIVVAHNAGFDMGVIKGACAATIQPTPKLRYLCSVQVARKTYELPSYKLPSAAAAAGFREFSHHDALADAEASAAIISDAAGRHGVDDLDALAKATKLSIKRLVATPLKL